MRYSAHQWIKFLRDSFPKPANDAELAIVSEIFFGEPLALSELSDHHYTVKQEYSSYHGSRFAFSAFSLEGYDRSAGFWEWALGPLNCGGIATRSYGSFTPVSHRDKARITRWQFSRRKDKGRTPRPAFVRLAAQCGERKNRGIRGVSVPIHGPGGWSRGGFSNAEIEIGVK